MTGIDITEKQSIVLTEFNDMIFQKSSLSDVPLIRALQNSIKK